MTLTIKIFFSILMRRLLTQKQININLVILSTTEQVSTQSRFESRNAF